MLSIRRNVEFKSSGLNRSPTGSGTSNPPDVGFTGLRTRHKGSAGFVDLRCDAGDEEAGRAWVDNLHALIREIRRQK